MSYQLAHADGNDDGNDNNYDDHDDDHDDHYDDEYYYDFGHSSMMLANRECRREMSWHCVSTW